MIRAKFLLKLYRGSFMIKTVKDIDLKGKGVIYK